MVRVRVRVVRVVRVRVRPRRASSSRPAAVGCSKTIEIASPAP